MAMTPDVRLTAAQWRALEHLAAHGPATAFGARLHSCYDLDDARSMRRLEKHGYVVVTSQDGVGWNGGNGYTLTAAGRAALAAHAQRPDSGEA